MNGATPSRATMPPFTSPTSAPAPIPTSAATTAAPAGLKTRSTVPLVSAIAASTPANPTTDPTERSMPAVMITKMEPRARIPLIETWSRIVVRLARLMKPGMNTPATTTMPARASGTPKRAVARVFMLRGRPAAPGRARARRSPRPP